MARPSIRRRRGRELAEAGYVAPHWPRPWGLDADPIHQLIIDDELAKAERAGDRSTRSASAGPAPTILYAGSKEQKDRYLWPILAGEEFWCQLFSEPGSGSDLANLGTRAVRDGDEFVVNGQKIWTSGAQYARFGILIARTDPDLPKHKGVSYFVCPMDAPGIEIRPITEMTGGHTFNEVFFTDVRIPAANLVGDLNDGWRLAKVTLGNERISLSTRRRAVGQRPDRARPDRRGQGRRARSTDPMLRQRLAGVYIEHTVLELIRMRTLTARLKGEQPGPGGEHPQAARRRARPARDGAGPRPDRPGGDADRRRRHGAPTAPSSGPGPRRGTSGPAGRRGRSTIPAGTTATCSPGR